MSRLVLGWLFGCAPVTAPCAGDVLVAAPEVDDPDFAGAVVVVCSREDAGAIGFDVRPGRGGGPVPLEAPVTLWDTGEGLVLSEPAWWARDPGRRVVDATGYVGWGPGQLDAELAAGAWRPAPHDAVVEGR